MRRLFKLNNRGIDDIYLGMCTDFAPNDLNMVCKNFHFLANSDRQAHARDYHELRDNYEGESPVTSDTTDDGDNL